MFFSLGHGGRYASMTFQCEQLKDDFFNNSLTFIRMYCEHRVETSGQNDYDLPYSSLFFTFLSPFCEIGL